MKIGEEWKKTISEAANEVIQTQGRTTRDEWWDEECRQHIKKKNEARLNGSKKHKSKPRNI